MQKQKEAWVCNAPVKDHPTNDYLSTRQKYSKPGVLKLYCLLFSGLASDRLKLCLKLDINIGI